MNVKVPIPFWLLIVAFACLAPLDGRAWDIRDIMDPEKENLLRNPAYDILVITMLAVEDEHATNGNPPKVLNLRTNILPRRVMLVKRFRARCRVSAELVYICTPLNSLTVVCGSNLFRAILPSLPVVNPSGN